MIYVEGNLEKREKITFSAFRLKTEVIINIVGHKAFKAKIYLEFLENSATTERSIYRAHKIGSGGYVCGGVKLAMVLRMLAGASYLDISEHFHMR